MGRKAKVKKATEDAKIKKETTNKKITCAYDDSVNENMLSTESLKTEDINEPGDKFGKQEENTELQLPRTKKMKRYKNKNDSDVVNKKKIKIINNGSEVHAKNVSSDEKNNVLDVDKPKKIKRNKDYDNVIINKKIKFDCDSEKNPIKKNNNVKLIGNEEEMNVKEEDIDKYCEELDEESNKQYENWVKLIEANFKSNNKKKSN